MTVGEEITLSEVYQYDLMGASTAELLSSLEVPGIIVLQIFAHTSGQEEWLYEHPDFSESDYPSWQILQSLALIRIEYRLFERGNIAYHVKSAILTKLGSDFYFSCHDSSFRICMSNDVRYERKYLKGSD